jgi:hypothetical protein
MDFDRYGSAPDPEPADERRTTRDRGDEPLEQRLDRWVHRGRQLVDGVSGARPGSRQGPPPGANRPGGRAAGIDGLGRWMENRLDWLLDDGEDWREPWQEADGPRRGRLDAGGPPPAAPRARGVAIEGSARREPAGDGDSPLPRRRLEAISLRGRDRLAANPGASSGRPSGAESEGWPQDDVFKLERWQRPARQRSAPVGDPAPPDQDSLSGRPLPRSTRRR